MMVSPVSSPFFLTGEASPRICVMQHYNLDLTPFAPVVTSFANFIKGPKINNWS